jgi:hypothetical protein
MTKTGACARTTTFEKIRNGDRFRVLTRIKGRLSISDGGPLRSKAFAVHDGITRCSMLGRRRANGSF